MKCRDLFEDYGFQIYYIGVQTADGKKHCICGWYADIRLKRYKCPKGYHIYDFRADDHYEYIASVEPYVLVNHCGTFLTRTRIPFNENGNGDFFPLRYGHYRGSTDFWKGRLIDCI